MEHGEIFEWEGHTFRLVVEPDCDTDIRDFDCYGEVVHVSDHHHPHNGRSCRPDRFDGAARKIDAGRYRYWWQPPADVLDDPGMLAALKREVTDILAFGYKVWIVEMIETVADAYGRDHEVIVASAGMGGLEPFYDDDDSTAYDLAADCMWQLEQPPAKAV